MNEKVIDTCRCKKENLIGYGNERYLWCDGKRSGPVSFRNRSHSRGMTKVDSRGYLAAWWQTIDFPADFEPLFRASRRRHNVKSIRLAMKTITFTKLDNRILMRTLVSTERFKLHVCIFTSPAHIPLTTCNKRIPQYLSFRIPFIPSIAMKPFHFLK